MTDAASTPAVQRPGYRFYVLAILVFVYMLNFLDRQIIGILAAPLKAEFGLSDSQFGLLGGIAFASVYSTLAIPLAWLADRFSRVWIMTGALAVWSGFTALCGMAGSFGFEAPHYDVAMACGERVLLPEIRATPENTLIVADGFSCREQIAQATGREALHVAQVIDRATR